MIIPLNHHYYHSSVMYIDFFFLYTNVYNFISFLTERNNTLYIGEYMEDLTPMVISYEIYEKSLRFVS